MNGWIIASVIDCHGTGTAAAAATAPMGREMDTERPCGTSPGRCMSTSAADPDDAPMERAGRDKQIKAASVLSRVTLSSKGVVSATGRSSLWLRGAPALGQVMVDRVGLQENLLNGSLVVLPDARQRMNTALL